MPINQQLQYFQAYGISPATGQARDIYVFEAQVIAGQGIKI
jgi:hypothetical protein